MKYNIKVVSIEEVKAGDTLICSDGYLRTITFKDIKYDPFMGYSIFGNCF